MKQTESTRSSNSWLSSATSARLMCTFLAILTFIGVYLTLSQFSAAVYGWWSLGIILLISTTLLIHIKLRRAFSLLPSVDYTEADEREIIIRGEIFRKTHVYLHQLLAFLVIIIATSNHGDANFVNVIHLAISLYFTASIMMPYLITAFTPSIAQKVWPYSQQSKSK